MIHTRHGGHCCGINHISVFDYARKDTTPGELRDIYRRVNDGMAVEVVLTDDQLRRKPWLGPMLAKMGFRHMENARFRNPNSRNICNVFYYSPAFTTAEKTWSFDPADCDVDLDIPPIPIGTRVRRRRGTREYIVERGAGWLSPRVIVRAVDTRRRSRLNPRNLEVVNADVPNIPLA